MENSANKNLTIQQPIRKTFKQIFNSPFNYDWPVIIGKK